MDQESGSSFAEWFWLEIFHQVAVSIVACRWKGLVELEDLFPRWLTHTLDMLLLNVGKRFQLFHTNLLYGCLIVLITWQLAFPRTSDPKEQDGSCYVLYDLALEDTLTLL